MRFLRSIEKHFATTKIVNGIHCQISPAIAIKRTKSVLSLRPHLFHTSQLSTMAYHSEVNLRSDTVTLPTRPMLECIMDAPLGDDVFREDPTVIELEEYAANLLGKEGALYVPTGTMANLVAILSHCRERASEIIIGSSSHISLWEGGNVSNLGGIHTRQIKENDDATLPLEDVRDAYRNDDDDHYAKTELICVENTHNLMGGAILPMNYLQNLSKLKKELDIKLHIDGARLFNAAVALETPIAELCSGADSVSICLSKGLGAPVGSVLVGDADFIRLAKRARKRCGGGMRQAGVIAAMGMFALKNNVERLKHDHDKAKRFATELKRLGFHLPRRVDTNIVYFGLPNNSAVSVKELSRKLEESYKVKIGSGYSKKGELFRVVVHKDIDEEGIDRALDGLSKICLA